MSVLLVSNDKLTIRISFYTNKFFIALLGSATFLLLCGYLGNTRLLAVTFLTMGVGFGGISLAGFSINHIDIAPRFAGVLMGITNTAGTLPGILGPQIAKMIAQEVR